MIKRILHSSFRLGVSTTARHLYWVFSGNAASIILAFFTTILIARYISTEDFGLYLALFTFANLLADLGEAGIGASLSSFLPSLVHGSRREDLHRFTSTAFYIELTIGLVMGIVLVLISPWLASILFENTDPFHVIITGVTMIVLLLFNFSIYTLSALQKFRETATINIFYGLIRLLILFLIVTFSELTLGRVLIVFCVAPIFGWIYTFFHMKSEMLTQKMDWDIAKKLVGFSSLLSLQKLFVSVSSRLDMLMLVPLSSASEAGVYGAASRI